MYATEMRTLDDAALERHIADARQEMFNLRFRLATGRGGNSDRIRQLRKDIARAKTILHERREGRDR
jgi:large subunit ribosomal protein L29